MPRADLTLNPPKSERIGDAISERNSAAAAAAAFDDII